MDKDRRIRRYRRKDYTEPVDFPVEIVGRDGSVRRYDFEESVRLYQRRLHFAPMRFSDEDLVAAEQGHCRARIDQLRRSYFTLFGWDGPDGPHRSQPLHAGEIVSFLQHTLRIRERLDVAFTQMEVADEPGEVWYAKFHTHGSGFLLYCYAFDAERPEIAQAAFAARLRELQTTSDGLGDAERLIAWRHANDCGFVLTGQASEVVDIAAIAPADGAETPLDPTPWDEAVAYVRRADLPTAFLRCKWIVEEQPWHRDAYILGMALALLIRRSSDAEDLGFVGCSYAPRDALLRYYLALSQLHQRRLLAAAAGAEDALIRCPNLQAARNLLAWCHLRRGAPVAAWMVLRAGEASGHDGIVRQALLSLLLMSAISVACLVALLMVVVLALATGVHVLLAAAAVLAISLVSAGVSVERKVRVVHHKIRYEDPNLVLTRIERHRAGQPR